MGNKKSKKGIVIFLVLVAVLLMTIGFAAYTQNLTINGTANVTASSWSVHYNNDSQSTDNHGIVTSANSVAATSATIGTNDTDFAFTVTLAKPGDFYEAEIYPHNFGTLTAYLKGITMSTLTEAQAKYLTYTVTYDGTTYSASQSGITGKALAAGAQVPVKVRVEYKLPANSSDLPKTNQEISVTGSFAYSSEDTNS